MMADTLPRPSAPIVVAFRVVYAVLAAQFLFPAISYAVAPELTYATLDQVNRLLGGGPYPPDQSHVWHMLAVGNVLTLALLCGLLCLDLRRYYPALPVLLFLKGFSAAYSLARAVAGEPPVFYAVALLDGVTTLAMWFFATRAHRALR